MLPFLPTKENLEKSGWTTYISYLSCLFSSEPTTAPVISTVVSHQRKDYNYLKPSILAADCTRRELSKFSSECKIWLEKSLSVEDRADSRLVWASICAVIDDKWNEILSRDLKIAEKCCDEIYSIMDKVYLEKKTLIVQRLGALQVIKQKEELIGDEYMILTNRPS